jgi:hypothetical protein
MPPVTVLPSDSGASRNAPGNILCGFCQISRYDRDFLFDLAYCLIEFGPRDEQL